MFRKAVSTIEGVKSDALFSYQAPINLVALLIMFPASYLLSPRWFHKVNVFMIRMTSFPLLLVIAWYERQVKRSGSTNFFEAITDTLESIFDLLPKNMKRMTFFDGLAGNDAGIDAVFELEEEFNNTALDTEEFAPASAIEPPLSRVSSKSQSPRSSKSPLPKTVEISNDSLPPLSNPAQIPKQQRTSHSPPKSSISPPARFNSRARAKSMMHAPANRPEVPSTHSPPAQDTYGGVGPHRRVTSLLSRGQEAVQTFTSPLAQIFQPLVIDDFPEEDMDLLTANSPGLAPVTEDPEFDAPSHGISYGPASRRLSTIQRTPTEAPVALGWPKIRRASEGSSSSIGPDTANQMLSRSPESIGAGRDEGDNNRHLSLTPPIEEEGEDNHGDVLFRVAEIQRQMEQLQRQTQELQGQTRELLEQLARNLKKET
jgi:hypothetical protein